MNTPLSYVLGGLGILTTIIIYQQKERHKLLWWKLISDIVWIAYFLIGGATSGAAVTLVAVMRSIVFLNDQHKWAQSKLWLFVFMAASLCFSIIAWEGPLSLLTLVSSLACIVAYWLNKPKLTRVISIPAAGLYLVYTLIKGAFLSSLCEIFIILSSIAGYIRLDRGKKAGEVSASAGSEHDSAS